jgi:dihydroneopterin triphosphate diphosphatase
VNLQWTQVYEILPAFGKVYAAGVTLNLEHAFSLRLQDRVPITLSDAEHGQFRWLSATEAMETASSSTNRAVIAELRL